MLCFITSGNVKTQKKTQFVQCMEKALWLAKIPAGDFSLDNAHGQVDQLNLIAIKDIN